MDVGELLTFKPELSIKPPTVEKSNLSEKSRSSSSGGNPKKRNRLESNIQNAPYAKGPAPKEAIQAIQQIASNHSANLKDVSSIPTETERLIEDKLQLHERETEGQDPLDETSIKKMVLNFEKKVLKNQELRIKFPDDPKKFMESEIELHEAIEELHVLATVPDLYPLLISTGTVRTLLALLSHENTDLSIAVIDLMQEMTDMESMEESDGIDELVASLVGSQVLATLVHNLQRLDEAHKLEAEGVHNTLGIIENLSELSPEICNEAQSSGLLGWLLKRLKSKQLPFDGNKLYASEILAICLQSNAENQKAFPALEGMDVLLQQLSQYKRHDPTNDEEQEYMENLFDALCSCLLLAGNREPFLQAEGLQLMNLMLRERQLSRNGAIRVLDHALSSSEGSENCNKFIEILGLRTIFPLFMKTPKKHGPKGLSKEQHEEHIISIICWLLRNARSSLRQRLVNKFTENDHEKVDRLLELHFKYLDKVIVTNTALEEQAKAENLDEDALYLRRLDGGLYTLQLTDYIMLDICASGPPSIKRRVIKILNVRNASIKTIKNVIREYASNIGETADSTITEEQERILGLLDKFQNM